MSIVASPPEWLLAIDTSSEQAGLALSNGTRTSELIWHAGREQTVTTLAEIDHLFSLLQISFEQVGAIAVATGPGMFNGLRVGLSIAKGLHLAHGTPLIGVSTLLAAAAPFRTLAETVVAVAAAGRGRLVWQRYPGEDQPVNSALSDLADALRGLPVGTLVVGELTEEQAEVLRGLGSLAVPDASVRGRRPGALAGLGLVRWRSGQLDDPVALAPTYIHTAGAPSRG